MQADEYITAIGNRGQHGVVLQQLACCLRDTGSGQLGAIGTHQHNGLRERGGDPVHGPRHAFAQIAFALIAECNAVGQRHAVPRGRVGRGTHAQLNRSGPRLQCLREGLQQHALRQFGRTLRTQRRDQACLDGASHRSLGKDHQPARHCQRVHWYSLAS